MPPSKQIAAVEPDFDQSVASGDTTQGSYRFFKPGMNARFYKPKYNRETGSLTVFRPFPCRSFSNPETFEPYRKEPEGRNFFGYWLKRLHVVRQVGNPQVSYICHNPRNGIFDDRVHPYGVLRRAVQYAVKRGQGKADYWSTYVSKNPEPDAKTLLQWGGMFQGASGRRELMPYTEEMIFLQGILLVDDSKPTFSRDKAPIGWGSNPTCVLGLPQGVANIFVNLLNQEKEGYDGPADDFEARYVYGDPVSLQTGRFLYVFPKGCDPRLNTTTNRRSVEVNPYDINRSSDAGGSYGTMPTKQIGYDCYLDTKYGSIDAAMTSEQRKRGVLEKWIHWDDVRDARGNKIADGLLYYPTYEEQAQILASVFPADMLVYAFYGEKTEWLTEDVKRKAVNARSVPINGLQSQVANPTVPPSPTVQNSVEAFPEMDKTSLSASFDAPNEDFGGQPDESLGSVDDIHSDFSSLSSFDESDSSSDSMTKAGFPPLPQNLNSSKKQLLNDAMNKVSEIIERRKTNQ